MHQDGIAPARAAYEPFTAPGITGLPPLMEPRRSPAFITSGFQIKAAHRTLRLAVGYKEQWTPNELVLLPWSILKIYLWEGQNIFLILLPVAIVCVLGVLSLWRRVARGDPRVDLSQWLVALSGLFFLSRSPSLPIRCYWLSVTPEITRQALIPAIVAVVPVCCRCWSFVFALHRRDRVGFVWRLALIAAGILGFVLWAGLCLGPLLAIAAAFSPGAEACVLKPDFSLTGGTPRF